MTAATPASASPAAQSHARHRGKVLTAVAIERLKPRPYRYEVGDPGARGLRVVVHQS
jgi:hypothetical protein